MAVVKINALEVPDGQGAELERRFARTYESLRETPGFLDFELLRPTGGESRYFVYSKWETEEDFQNWKNGRGREQAHAEGQRQEPVATGMSLLEFEIALESHADSSKQEREQP